MPRRHRVEQHYNTRIKARTVAVLFHFTDHLLSDNRLPGFLILQGSERGCGLNVESLNARNDSLCVRPLAFQRLCVGLPALDEPAATERSPQDGKRHQSVERGAWNHASFTDDAPPPETMGSDASAGIGSPGGQRYPRTRVRSNGTTQTLLP